MAIGNLQGELVTKIGKKLVVAIKYFLIYRFNNKQQVFLADEYTFLFIYLARLPEKLILLSGSLLREIFGSPIKGRAVLYFQLV